LDGDRSAPQDKTVSIRALQAMSSPISILLADDHLLVCEALKSRIEQEPDMQVVAMAGNADQAASEAIRLNPDIVLMDIAMPGLVPFEAVKIIRIHSPETKIIFLSALSHDRCIEEALSSGAAGYLTKTDSPQSVIQGIRTVAAGGVCFSPEIQSRLATGPKGAATASKGPTRTSTLSRREMEVLQYLARGMSKKEIAHTMHISVKTVERHADRLMAKLDIHDRVELARFAIREGLAEP
jgi:DNA-binding NarL/FixJ family response regulator